MMQSDEVAGISWTGLLDAVPIPAAVVDRHGTFLYLNSAGDHVLRAVHAGSDECNNGAPGQVRRQARLRRTRSDEAIRAQKPVFFEEAIDDQYRMLWLYAPVRNTASQVEQVIVLGFDVTRVHQQAVEASRHMLVEHIRREIQVPLMALIGLAHSLAHELSGAQSEPSTSIRTASYCCGNCGHCWSPFQ